MRRLLLFGPFVAAIACNGRDAPRTAAAAQDLAVAIFADEGIRCVRQEPPPFRACVGLEAGAPCAWSNRNGRGRDFGVCKALVPDRIVCIGVDEPELPGDCDVDDAADGGRDCDAGVPLPGDGGLPPPTDGGLPGGDGGVLPGDDGGLPGGDGGVLPGDDGGLPGGDGGVLPGDDGGLPGGDGGLPSGDGGVPGTAGSASPIAPAFDACAAHDIHAACSFTFYGRAIDGACRKVPGAATLVCAPLCGDR